MVGREREKEGERWVRRGRSEGGRREGKGVYGKVPIDPTK